MNKFALALIVIFFHPVTLINSTSIKKHDHDLDTINKQLKNHVTFLSTIQPYRNYLNTNSLNTCGRYIFSEFQKYSTNVLYQKYFVDRVEYKNVICILNPENKKTIVVGAHYDVCGNQSGADDNASGVACLIEIGKILSRLSLTNYRIELVAYSLEEPPFFRTEDMGSYIHARSLREKNINIEYMVCLEMLGYFSDLPNSQNYPLNIMGLFFGKIGNYIAVIEQFGQNGLGHKFKKNLARNSDIRAIHLSSPKKLTGIDFSDHMNYWKNGYNAIMITDTSFYRNSNYHESTDTISTLNFDKMTELSIGVASTIVNPNIKRH